jgi:hypothetical protein
VGENFLEPKKRIVSGVEKLDIMRFLVGSFTPFSSEIEFFLIYI